MLGAGRAFDTRQEVGEPFDPRHSSVQTAQTTDLSTHAQSKKPSRSTPKCRHEPSPHDLPDLDLELPDFGGAFEFRLDGRQLRVSVAAAARPHVAAIDRLAACTAEFHFCDQVVVSVPKTHAAFADWMRQLLYTGFQVLSKKSAFFLAADPGTVCCVLDVLDVSSSSNSDTYESSVLTDDGDSDADSVASEDSWLDEED